MQKHQNYEKFETIISDFTNKNPYLIDKNEYDEAAQLNYENELEQHSNSKYSPPEKIESQKQTNYFYSPITYNGSEKGDTKNISPNSQSNLYDVSYNIRPVDSRDKKSSILKLYKMDEPNKSPVKPIYQVLIKNFLIINYELDRKKKKLLPL